MKWQVSPESNGQKWKQHKLDLPNSMQNICVCTDSKTELLSNMLKF